MRRREKEPDQGDWTQDPRGPMTGFTLTVPRLVLGTRRLGSAGRHPRLRRRMVRLPSLAERRQWRRSALAIRLAQVAAGLAVLLLVPGFRLSVTVVLLLGLLGAVVSPSRTGQLLVLAAGIAGWVFGSGAHGTPAVPRVLAFAVALFVLHDATSLASTVPMTADLRPEVVRGWLLRSGTTLLVAGVLTGVVYAVGGLVNFHSGYPLELAGLTGIAVALGVAAWLFSRSLR
jgi:hypothetical protein